MVKWFEQAKEDLDCLERLGADCDRQEKLPVVAIGQEEFHPCARGVIWDCRSLDGGTLLDYTAPTSSKLNLDYLRRRFAVYPDQRLASYIVEEMRLEADVELQMVLHPNLISIGDGYDSVQKTVRELGALGFYEFYTHLPFAPIYVIGQGSRIKKLGVCKYRRTSNFSAPHKKVTDRAGIRVVPINDASKCYLVPEWLAKAQDERLQRWHADRYSHVQWRDEATRDASARQKFPKEHKPQLEDVMRDLAILLGAAQSLGEPIFVWE